MDNKYKLERIRKEDIEKLNTIKYKSISGSIHFILNRLYLPKDFTLNDIYEMEKIISYTVSLAPVIFNNSTQEAFTRLYKLLTNGYMSESYTSRYGKIVIIPEYKNVKKEEN